jgi:hypothetical protein
MGAEEGGGGGGEEAEDLSHLILHDSLWSSAPLHTSSWFV